MKTNFAVIQCYGGTEWWWEIPVLTLCPELLAVIHGRDWLHQAYSSMELIPLWKGRIWTEVSWFGKKMSPAGSDVTLLLSSCWHCFETVGPLGVGSGGRKGVSRRWAFIAPPSFQSPFCLRFCWAVRKCGVLATGCHRPTMACYHTLQPWWTVPL